MKKKVAGLSLNCCRKSPEGDKLTSSSESLQMREEEVSNLLIFISLYFLCIFRARRRS